MRISTRIATHIVFLETWYAFGPFQQSENIWQYPTAREIYAYLGKHHFVALYIIYRIITLEGLIPVIT